ncbi:DNA (Cytosine-5)-methyltransferase DRM1/2 isoform 2 [Hibiscus syriacus]|uniref:DNA (Cytosine-5)-methyltransferase DRM1/2 isoform 2 n=1 Tax=Hibiscus syriacus TaxID=106335 RepID=A0A6A2WZD0_HIBSY|nr:DNA (Cytosine-5)-methyltransferase DRM1/2 isoform 2 [Hibiscus syriacus]
MQHVDSDNNSSDYEAIFQDDFTDIDSSSDIEEIMNSDFDEESKLLYLTKMGFSEAEVLIAMERCGPDSSIAELIDFICADQMAKVTDALLMVEDRKPLCNDPNYKQRRNLGYDLWKRKKQRKLEKKLLNEDDHAVHLLIPMIGSGVPTESDQITQRTLPEDAIGSPYFYYEKIHLSNPMIDQITQRTLPEDAIESSYFYYEHMALAPVNVWTGISQYLFDVEPEFVDSKHFHATTLKMAIFIILPIENRFSLILLLPCADNKIVPLESDEVEMLLEVAFYCLGILLKTDVQELNDDRLEQLMSSFIKFDLVQSSEGHNEYHLDKENDQHRRSSNNVSRLEPASRYNQSACSDLFMAL